MKLISIDYEPVFEVEFSAYEIQVMREGSDHHYDHTCKSLNQPGGILYGMNNTLELGDSQGKAVWNLKRRDVELLRKILEMTSIKYPNTGPAVYWGLTKLLADLVCHPAKPI